MDAGRLSPAAAARAFGKTMALPAGAYFTQEEAPGAPLFLLG